ncbi:SDR family NAD(P)-dependent oxidoreductase [Pusillimonas sp. T2]|uniref:SDR family NAD(P)-dependent oxidoreductase n=1 Tax=Pusillimonas sp. T2 TaxID=1548123 RepID=UPI0020B1517F|nr:SDR family oxidoreductase [Pusillimonas sp. T2]
MGAASGIGRETALACAAVGAQVLAMDIDSQGLSTLVGGNIDTCSIDIADSGAVDSVIQDWQKQYGRIDAAVLTSAIQKRTLIDELSNAEWQRHLDVNLTGVFYLLRALFPIMKRQRSGAIVTFTSGLASAGWPGAAAYASTKAGIIGLVKSAALELRAFGVRINAVSPGLVATPVFLKSATDDELAMYEKSLGVSTPDEVVPSLMFLISDSAKTVSGNVFERRLVPRAE